MDAKIIYRWKNEELNKRGINASGSKAEKIKQEATEMQKRALCTGIYDFRQILFSQSGGDGDQLVANANDTKSV